MANMVHEVSGNLILVLHSSALPTDEEWRAYVQRVAKMPTEMRQLVLSDGGRPNAEQRSELDEVLRTKYNIGAVVSSSGIIRHVVAAINWLGPHNLKSFAAHELNKALKYIRVTKHEAPQIMNRIAVLTTKLDSSLQALAKRDFEMHHIGARSIGSLACVPTWRFEQ
jgi:hypothetical protein